MKEEKKIMKQGFDVRTVSKKHGKNITSHHPSHWLAYTKLIWHEICIHRAAIKTSGTLQWKKEWLSVCALCALREPMKKLQIYNNKKFVWRFSPCNRGVCLVFISWLRCACAEKAISRACANDELRTLWGVRCYNLLVSTSPASRKIKEIVYVFTAIPITYFETCYNFLSMSGTIEFLHDKTLWILRKVSRQ